MPTLKFWDGTQYVPISTGGSGGGSVNPEDIPNEVLVDATGVAPTDPETELWVDEADPGIPPVSVLNDLNDVDTITTPPAVDDNLSWNGTTWAAKSAAATLNSLTDVDAPTPSHSDVLRYNFNTGMWEAVGNVTKVSVQAAAPTGPALGDIWIVP